MDFLKRMLRKYREKSILRKSNYGRHFGWYIEYESQIIGELINCEFLDEFWDVYTITKTNKVFEDVLFDKKEWLNNSFQLKNKTYDLYVKNAFFSEDQEDFLPKQKIKVRGLYIIEL